MILERINFLQNLINQNLLYPQIHLDDALKSGLNAFYEKIKKLAMQEDFASASCQLPPLPQLPLEPKSPLSFQQFLVYFPPTGAVGYGIAIISLLLTLLLMILIGVFLKNFLLGLAFFWLTLTFFSLLNYLLYTGKYYSYYLNRYQEEYNLYLQEKYQYQLEFYRAQQAQIKYNQQVFEYFPRLKRAKNLDLSGYQRYLKSWQHQVEQGRSTFTIQSFPKSNLPSQEFPEEKLHQLILSHLLPILLNTYEKINYYWRDVVVEPSQESNSWLGKPKKNPPNSLFKRIGIIQIF